MSASVPSNEGSFSIDNGDLKDLLDGRRIRFELGNGKWHGSVRSSCGKVLHWHAESDILWALFRGVVKWLRAHPKNPDQALGKQLIEVLFDDQE